MADEDLSKLRIKRDVTSTSAIPAKKRSRRAIVAALAIAALFVVIFFYGGVLGSAVEVEPATVTTAYPSQAYTLLNATGYVVAQRKAAVASKATGRLEWLGVAEGSRVKKSDVIARLENQDVTATMEQAQANVRLASANLEQAQAELSDAEAALNRSKELVAKKFISQAAHDAAVARYQKAVAAISGGKAAINVANANLKAARIAVEQTLIRAPFDGVVLSKHANVGDVVSPFTTAADTKGAVVSMADMETLEVEADVSESNLQKVRVGQPCEIQLDALPDVRFRGVVHRVVPTVDRAKATVLVKVQFIDRDDRFLPEMGAKVAFLSEEVPPEQRRPYTVVHPSAVVIRDGKNVVFLIREGKAVEVPIETGRNIGDLVEIVKGVKPGDKVVLKPSEKLKDGRRVKLPEK